MHPSIFTGPSRFGWSYAEQVEEVRYLADEGYPASAAIAKALSAVPAAREEYVQVKVKAVGSSNSIRVPTSILGEFVKVLVEDPEVTFVQIGTDNS